MDALFAVQSLLHCVAVFGSAIADCDKASSPTNAAHKAAATFGFITHPPGRRRPTFTQASAARNCRVGKLQTRGAALTGSPRMFSFCSNAVKTNREHRSKKGTAARRPPLERYRLLPTVSVRSESM